MAKFEEKSKPIVVKNIWNTHSSKREAILWKKQLWSSLMPNGDRLFLKQRYPEGDGETHLPKEAMQLIEQFQRAKVKEEEAKEEKNQAVNKLKALMAGYERGTIGTKLISGELELRTTCDDDGALTLAITYVGAEYWYTLPGEDYRLYDPRDHEVVHHMLATVLEPD